MELAARRPEDRPAVEAFLRDRNALRAARRGVLVDSLDHPAVLAWSEGELVGVATYVVEGDGCELLTLHAASSWTGVGSALLAAVQDLAREAGCRRLWVVTTNDNVDALRFYQRRGFRLTHVRPGAVDRSRETLKPEIPRSGAHGIPLRDELELEMTLPGVTIDRTFDTGPRRVGGPEWGVETGTGRLMSRWGLRAGVLLAAGGLVFVWAPDVDLGEGWGGGGGRAATAPEAGSRADADTRTACAARDIDTTPDPSTDITDFSAERSASGLVLTAELRDLRPDAQQDAEFDIRTSRGRDLTVGVQRREEGGPVEVRIGDAPGPVRLAASDECGTGVAIGAVSGCAGLTGRMDSGRDLVVVRVPRHCLGDPRWVRAGVSTVRYVSETEIPHDVWLPPDGDALASFGPLGPWVSLS